MMPIEFRIIIGIIFSFFIIACSMASTALKEQGSYPSPDRICTAVLEVSPQGGFLQLSVQTSTDHLVHVADDVTGLLWINEKVLVFSSSPIYGEPGIFEVTCDGERANQNVLVHPISINPDYPNGADYFELKEIKGRNLHFYYGADVDNIDFNEFRTEKYLRSEKWTPIFGQ